MADTRTQPTSPDIESFIAALDDSKKDDARRLVALMRGWSGEEPVLWGSIIGFGRYHYRYASGHEGDAPLIGFAPRRNEFSIYLMGTYSEAELAARQALLDRLGKHRMGKACLYVKKLDDIDLDVLGELARLSLTALREAYPDK